MRPQRGLVFKCEMAGAPKEIQKKRSLRETMIITNKQFPNYRKFEMVYEGRPLSMEVGKLAELCNAAVLVKYGETTDRKSVV